METIRRIQRIKPGLGVHLVDPCGLTDDPHTPGEQDPQEQGAGDPALIQLRRHDGPDDRQQGAQSRMAEILPELNQRGQTRAGQDQFRCLECDENDEQSDPDADGGFERTRNDVEQEFPHPREGEQDEQHSLDENGHHGELPGNLHCGHDRKREKRDDTDSRGKRKGISGQDAHQESAQRGRQSRRDHGAACRKSDFAHDIRIEREDVSHGKESGQSGQQFGPDADPGFKLFCILHLIDIPFGL